MTEGEWLACNSPESMLECLRSREISERKYRLFACACCRRIWHLLDGWSRNYIEVLERYLLGLADKTALTFAEELHSDVLQKAKPYTSSHIAAAIVEASKPGVGATWPLAWNTVSEIRRALRFHSPQAKTSNECNAQASILREIIGNPFRPIALDLSWLARNDALVPKLARTIYGECAFDRLSILADALEEADCNNADILNHCRQSGEHLRGCWVIDLFLGKE